MMKLGWIISSPDITHRRREGLRVLTQKMRVRCNLILNRGMDIRCMRAGGYAQAGVQSEFGGGAGDVGWKNPMPAGQLHLHW